MQQPLNLIVSQSRFAGLHNQQVTQLPIDEDRKWRRSHTDTGGDEFGSFRVSGSFKELQTMFDTWLGYHIEERRGRRTSWQGYVHKLTLHHKRIQRSISLDNLYNAIAVPYEKLLLNGNFQELGVEPQTFIGWTEVEDGGLIGVQADLEQAYSAILSHFSSRKGETYIEQVIPVQVNTTYTLTVNARGDSQNAPRLEVLDNLTLGSIIPKTDLNSSAQWQHQSFEFRTGWSQTAVKLRFYVPANDGVGYIDDVTFEPYNGHPTLTDWEQNHASIQQYGRRELIPTDIPSSNMTVASADAYRDNLLAQHAWPKASELDASPSDETYLEIVVVGYWGTAYFRYNQWSSFHAIPLHQAVSTLAESQCDWLGLGMTSLSSIKYELVGVKYGQYERVGTLLNQIQKLADGETGWSMIVSDGSRIEFRPIAPVPIYYEDNGRFFNHNNLPHRLEWLQAGVVAQSRNWPGRNTGGCLKSNQFVIHSFEVEPATGSVSWE